MIDIGWKVRFVPCWIKGGTDTKDETREKSVVGRVIYIDRAHKKFTVKYPCGGTTQFETFKLSQIGQDVFAVRGGKNGR